MLEQLSQVFATAFRSQVSSGSKPVSCLHAGRVEDLPASVFHRLMTINYLGVVHSVKAVLPGMLQNRSGHISFVSSSMGLIGM